LLAFKTRKIWLFAFKRFAIIKVAAVSRVALMQLYSGHEMDVVIVQNDDQNIDQLD